MIIHFLSIPTLSQPFNTVSSLFRMYSSIPCGQALLSAGRFFCGTKEEVIIIAKNIAMYLKLTNTPGVLQASIPITRNSQTGLSQQLNGHITLSKLDGHIHFGFYSSSTAIYLCSNGWWSLCQGSAIGLSLVLSDTIEAPLSDIHGE